MTGPSFWFVNKPNDVGDEGLADYLATGIWQSPNVEKSRDVLAAMTPGRPIALKIVQNRTTGLPFFNADRPASVMSIFATGTIESIDPDAGVVRVHWAKARSPREWYFWTHLKPVWRVDPDSQPRARQLVDFAFEGMAQDMDTFLDSDYWSHRYAKWPKFSWIPFYEEFATKLLQFADNRTGLVDILLAAAKEEPLLSYVSHDQFVEGEFGPLRDVDPFTVFGVFNRGITEVNRQSIAARLGAALGVTAPLPQDFDGIPILNNQNSWFMSYAYRRSPNDIDCLWEAFAAGINLKAKDSPESRSAFADAYAEALKIRGVRWNLTVGMYWIRPERFVTLDVRSRAYLQERYSLGEPANGDEYLALCDRLQGTFASKDTTITSFPLLSYAAWMGGEDPAVPHSIEGMVTWLTRVAESSDLERTEHEYKRNAAALAAQAREQATSGDHQWPATLKKALNATNTIDYRFKDTLNTALAGSPEAGLSILDILWRDPQVEGLDEFQEALRGFLGTLTPGNATALGSLMLMASDPEGNAPYSPSRTERWYALTGSSGPDQASSATSRYRTMLSFLDSLREELESREEMPVPTRLEVQGMAWATTESAPPHDWDEEQRKALLEWRGHLSEYPRAWLARGKTPVTSWVDDGYVSLAASYLGALGPGSSIAEVKAAIEAGYQHQDYGQRKALVDEYFAFLSVMKAGDLITAMGESQLHVGVVEGAPEYVEDQGDRLRRPVTWKTAVPLTELSADLRAMLDRQGALVDITEALSELQVLLSGPRPLDTPRGISLPPADAALANELFMPPVALQEIIELLASRKQIVFYGPPGTGKTFIAKAISRHIIGQDDPSRMQLVQFHPSYAYEDFFEGYRPYETDAGQASFALQPGPLARIARAAKDDPSHPYVLVIDEMNRANLAKVFGELYFLLEYRKESIQLQYRPSEVFRLPENLYIIGTMNTADRSIALLDAAMRRRFSFVELHPEEEPVKGVLRAWLAEGNHTPERALLLDALNSAIDDQDRDMRIGPSYLMREEAATEGGLARVWKYDIMPLLEEHYYGRLTREQIRSRFGLVAVRAVITGNSTLDDEDSAPDDLFRQDAPS